MLSFVVGNVDIENHVIKARLIGKKQKAISLGSSQQPLPNANIIKKPLLPKDKRGFHYWSE